MSLAILLVIPLLLWLAASLGARVQGQARPAPPSPFLEPPKVYSNLPQIDRVDIHALFKKWED